MQMIIYCYAARIRKAYECLQSAFDIVQAQLYQLKLVLNAEKTKVMFFSNARKNELDLNIVTDQGKTIEVV